MKNWQYALMTLAVILVAIAFFLMLGGEILGESTIGIATIIAFVGFGLGTVTYLKSI